MSHTHLTDTEWLRNAIRNREADLERIQRELAGLRDELARRLREKHSRQPGVRFLLCPGMVPGRGGTSWHYVSADELARLYQLPPGGWIDTRVARGEWCKQLIPLHPRADGNYVQPDEVRGQTEPKEVTCAEARAIA